MVVQVRAGVGGEEGALFAMDLFRMYQKYAQLHKWKSDVCSALDLVSQSHRSSSR